MIHRKCDYCGNIILGGKTFYKIEILETDGEYKGNRPLWKREMCRKCYRDGKKFVEKWDGMRES